MSLDLEWLRKGLSILALDEAYEAFNLCKFEDFLLLCRFKVKRVAISDFLVERAKAEVNPLILLSKEVVQNGCLILLVRKSRLLGNR